MKLALIIFVVVFVILFVASNKIIDYAFLRPKVGNQRSPDKYKDNELWVKYAKETRIKEKELAKNITEQISVTTFDGLKLNGYYVKAKKPSKKFVIGFHGYQDYGLMDMGLFEPLFHALGFNMIIPDNRAHGLSEGKYIGFGILDSIDCVSWCNYAVDRFGEDIKIILFGVSMGGATVLTASGKENLPKQVVGVISDSGFSSPKKQISLEMEQLHLPHKIFIPLANILNMIRCKFSIYSSSAINSVQHAHVPILLIHGTNDIKVPISMAYEIYDNIKGKKELKIFENAGHCQSIILDSNEYKKVVSDFLKEI